MKNGNAHRNLVMRPGYILIFAFIIMAVAVAVPIYSVRSSSARTDGSSEKKLTSKVTAKVSQVGSLTASNSHALSPWATMFGALLPTPNPPTQSITTYDADCLTPRSDFLLGETVCAKATGVPVTIFSWHVSWVDT